ncbi:expressed protein [Dictyostelium purpureum]|uniref:Expressed protein n=1 Tax=Dictyostelium purpureum TaxID=5786 RepID=F0ZXI8_DICPU|nr:uncharacterized protein DICPUDRAFT_99240 [Dictyostelium purpureum]EGC31356.1 expressed protein [Dictyostelium purpureum]|eukprot:XP_003292132.1 expressed protein [Dictyostelium purpureum]
MGSTTNPHTFQDELNNNNNNNHNNVFKYNPLFDLESNKENNLNQANYFNNNINNNNNNNKDKKITLPSTTLNISGSFSIGLNKKPLLSPRLLSPRVLSPRSIGNSTENIFQPPPQQQHTSSLLEDTISNLNNSSSHNNNGEEVVPHKKHRNSQILSKNFISLSLETDSPKHSRSTTDLNTFFHESDPDQYIYNTRSKTICGGDLHSLVLDFGNNNNNNNNNNNIFTKFQTNNNNKNNNNIENLENLNNNVNKPTVVHSHSLNFIPNTHVNNMSALPSVLSSSAPSLMSLLESSSNNNSDTSLNEEDVTVNNIDQHISFCIDSPLKDSMCQDEDDDDSTPPTPIQRQPYRSASAILSPPLLVSSSGLFSRQNSALNNDQVFASSPELSPMAPTPVQNINNNPHNQSHTEDDSPNTSLDNFGSSSPYKTPSKLSSSSSFFIPQSNSSSSPSAGSKRSRTCLDFTRYTSNSNFEEEQQQQHQHQHQQLSSSPTNPSLSQTTVSPTISPRIISPTTTTSTLSSIQQNLKQNLNVPSYLNHLQRSNSISSSRPPRPLSMSMSVASFRAPDIASAVAANGSASSATITNKPLPFDNIPMNNSNESSTNVYKNETQQKIIKFIEEQNKRSQQQQNQTSDSSIKNKDNTEDENNMIEEDNLVDFEHEQNKPKLLACKQTQGYNSVLCETVYELLNSKNTDALVTIIDCRYEYEYLGGHIKSAINIPPIGSEQKVIDTFFTNPTPKDKQHIIIFHCEFSSKRAPDW